MLDSGAFSVWNRGESIDLDAYIEFCKQNPTCPLYVNLDVIPGKPNDVKSLTLGSIEDACKRGWANYLRMIEVLPQDKVIPVFHQGDNIRWLLKYIDIGAPYIGVSPANDRTTDQKARWLNTVKEVIAPDDSPPIVKTHGFAVTSNRLMTIFPWYSVDSATWVQSGGMGRIFVPQRRSGKWDFSVNPFTIDVSDRSPRKGVRGEHLMSLSPLIRKHLDDWLSDMGIGLGTYEVIERDKDKLAKGERWYDKTKKRYIRVLEKGLMTDDQRRKWVNMRFFQEANKALPLERIYLAGLGVCKKIEVAMVNRLLSFVDVGKLTDAKIAFNYHCGVCHASESRGIPEAT